MIRSMQMEDLETVNEIFNDAILNTTALYKYSPETIEQRIEWFLAKEKNNDPIFVLEENGEVVGFATYSQFRPYPAYKYTVEHSVYVHKDHYRKGIGSKLMKHLITEAEKREVKTMIACIDASNEGSILSHQKLGFYYTGKIQNAGYKFGRWLDIVFYQLDLKGPEQPTEQ
ncbi:GNAT family N-acetyltransferase [Ureibacillus manganicus]|uniref:Phosphinothricin acetyltransferase n=1 Tax=Ureibacillus manganicus DSM 26584 TaxID=1384049 RepID=A0A0A3HXR9_9BACL|nr:GNAT family N-acetyltransferase [Ureibacillus manganicus]KGR76025.1 phosphinothricin acetyltransferase [Ureibacillus manganicus DSM 26584]